ncbi:MAG: flagellar assembly protein FliW [Pseudomonadota bacterium]
MKVNTTRFGEIEIEDEKIINMQEGVLGFPDSLRFIILSHKEDSPFFWYQSLDNEGLAFVIASPFLFKPDYKLDVCSISNDMNWPEDVNLDVFVIVTIPKGRPQDMTANLLGPIVINIDTQQAAQVIINDPGYTHKYRFMEGQEAA